MLSFNIVFDSNKSGVINGNAQLCVLQIIFGVVVLFNKISFKRYSINLDKALTLGQQRNISLQVAKITQDLSEIQFAEAQRNQNMTAQLQASAIFLGRGVWFFDHPLRQ